MAGTMTISVDSYPQLTPLAQRVLCWAAADRQRVRIDTQGPVPRIVIPEEIMGGKGTLLLRRGGADVLAGYVSGTNAVYAATNALGAMSRGQSVAQVCVSDAAQPTFSNAVLTGYQLALTYANVAAAGTVNIDWGDGTSTAGAAESGTSNHTYSNPGTYRVQITDASSAADSGFLVVTIPRG
jgi:hypothetical protein